MNTVPPSPAAHASGVDEINRLHAEAERLSAESRDVLDAALVAAWKAGQLLAVEKRSVRRSMGPGAWQLWLERYFTGTARTAQRYMRPSRGILAARSGVGMGGKTYSAPLWSGCEARRRADDRRGIVPTGRQIARWPYLPPKGGALPASGSYPDRCPRHCWMGFRHIEAPANHPTPTAGSGAFEDNAVGPNLGCLRF